MYATVRRAGCPQYLTMSLASCRQCGTALAGPTFWVFRVTGAEAGVT
jgi:hypothetical protein